MARETKVGLLAGLAFIICFAIILANRGRRETFAETAARRTTALADARSASAPITPTPSPRPARRPLGDAPASRTPSPTPSTPVDSEAPPSDSGSSIALPPDESIDGRADALADGDASGTGGVAVRTDPSADREALTALLDDLSVADAHDGTTTPAVAPPKNPEIESDGAAAKRERTAAAAPQRIQTAGASPASGIHSEKAARRYKVVAGDTLSKIAQRSYSSRSRRIIDAIVDANRSVLTDPDVLRVGVELRLPVLPGSSPGASSTTIGDNTEEHRSTPGGAATTPADRAVRWYQIRKNDRYVTIAREQLGDEGRWREIYELNRDKFPDAGQIREGVRIKLPRRNESTATERGR